MKSSSVYTGVIVVFALFLMGALYSPVSVKAVGLPSADAIIAHINEARAVQGLPALVPNSALTVAATSKARDIASQGVLVHTSAPAGTAWVPLANAGYLYSSVGENLAVNIADPAVIVDDWMGSPSHRANILNAKYADIGIGIWKGMYSGVQADFVVMYSAEPKPLKPGIVKSSVATTLKTVSSATRIAEIRSMLALLSQYLLTLTAQKAEASGNK